MLAADVTLPPRVLVGFTGANGGLTDRHAVSNVSIVSREPTQPGPCVGVPMWAPKAGWWLWTAGDRVRYSSGTVKLYKCTNVAFCNDTRRSLGAVRMGELGRLLIFKSAFDVRRHRLHVHLSPSTRSWTHWCPRDP